MSKEKLVQAKLWMEKTIAFKGFIKYIHNPELMMSTIKPLNKIPYTLTVNNNERFALLEPTETLFGKPCYWLVKGYPLSIKIKMVQTNFPIMVNGKVETKKETLEIVKDANINNTQSVKVKKEIDELNIDIIETEKIEQWKKEFELTKGKKPINQRTKQYTFAFNEYLKEKLENDKTINLLYDNNDLEQIVLEKVILPMFHTSFDFETFTQSGYTETVLGKRKITVNQVLVYVLSLLLTGFTVFTFVNSYYQAIIEGLR